MESQRWRSITLALGFEASTVRNPKKMMEGGYLVKLHKSAAQAFGERKMDDMRREPNDSSRLFTRQKKLTNRQRK